MARIRTIKPEFWDSPSTAKASPWARLAYIAMWNWADDHGRGTANLKELEGFIFPNDTFPVECGGNTVHFREVVAEVSECFGVVLYEVAGRPYYAIPSWDSHQRNERRAKESRHPEPPSQTGSSGNTVRLRSADAETPRTSGLGTGEQGNRGTGEQVESPSADADAPKPRRATRIPADYTPSRQLIDKAQVDSPNIDLRREHAKFIDHFTANGKTMKDWDAAWRNWMRRASEYAPRTSSYRQQQTDDLFASASARMGVPNPTATNPLATDPNTIKGGLA